MKVRNLKANHNVERLRSAKVPAVLVSMKVWNLKANHNQYGEHLMDESAVLASMKVRNLKANHNRGLFTTAHLVVIVIGCWSAYG